ncbi:hypothetical protein [Limimaricola cinnabarinus]|uniref:hypothetical protein n=1 Tax=Limimaricola cinnabarinus TaxID=1125964 RepID=UPI00248FF5CC|nr:hypothetical protein [Limimaricola cinnabarinus]
MEFIDMLLDKMELFGLPQPVLDFVATHPGRIYSAYDPTDPHDITILNNKIVYLRDLVDQAGVSDGSEPIPDALASAILHVLEGKR